MNHKELKERIAAMPASRIMGMRPENLAILTDKYCEELVIDIVVKDDSNNGQRRILEQIKTSYASWMKSSFPMWGVMGVGEFPEYLRKMAFELDCGNVITKTTNAKSKGAEASVKSKNTSAETSQLKARIEELEKGMEALQKDNEKLRKSQKSMWKVSGETLLIGGGVEGLEKKNEDLRGANAGSTEESAELRARIEELENDLDALIARDKKSMMTASQAAIFLLTVCHNLGGIPNDKKKLSPILQRGWGFSEATAERALGAKATKEAAERVAALFRDISPKLERLINEFPDEFDRIKNQKLRDNNERKVKKS